MPPWNHLRLSLEKEAPPASLVAGIAHSHVGPCLICTSPSQRIHLLSFGHSPVEAEAFLRQQFPHRTFQWDHRLAQHMADRIFEGTSMANQASYKLTLTPTGTPFQFEVWQALMRIPQGCTLSYSQLASMAGRPTAVRAVASAAARNPIALLIPCHRILRADGAIGNYRWGHERKRDLLTWEGATLTKATKKARR